MQTFEQEGIYYSDVDDTLIVWSNDDEKVKGLVSVKFWDPVLRGHLYAHRNDGMIRLLKEKHARGFLVVVHSQGGGKYAAAVVEALGLQAYVHVCMGKATCYGDDLPVEKWWPPHRIFIPPEKKYKNG